MEPTRKILIVLAVLAGLAGCSSPPEPETPDMSGNWNPPIFRPIYDEIMEFNDDQRYLANRGLDPELDNPSEFDKKGISAVYFLRRNDAASPANAEEESSVPAQGTVIVDQYGNPPFTIPSTINEPRGLPKFKLFDQAYGFEKRPNNTCEWVAYKRQNSWTDRAHFVPKAWVSEATPKEENGETILIGGKFKINATDYRRCNFPGESSWKAVLKEALSRFYQEPRSYQGELLVAVAYGLLQSGNNRYFDTAEHAHHDFRTRVLHRIYGSHRLIQRVYLWAMPFVDETWQQLRDSDRIVYRNILRHGQKYLATFDYEVEVKYLHRLEAGKCTEPSADDGWDKQYNSAKFHGSQCTYWFVRVGPDNKENPYRKFEAFLFRRVHQDGMNVEELKYWLNRVIRHLG